MRGQQEGDAADSILKEIEITAAFITSITRIISAEENRMVVIKAFRITAASRELEGN